MTTIVLADNHAAVRKYVHTLLDEEQNFHVAGEAAGGLEATELVETLHPDILVVDLMMEDMNGIQVAQRVTRSSPKTGVIIYSIYDNKAYVVEALRAGAKAYVLKGSGAAELVRAIREVAAGHKYLPDSLAQYSIKGNQHTTCPQ